MPGLTVDTQILVFGSGKSDPDREIPCRQLMEEIRDRPDAALVIDTGAVIMQEYTDQIGSGWFARKWLATLYSRKGEKLEFVPRQSLPDRARVPLDEVGFHQEDRKFVSAAHLSSSQRLVAEEQGYTEQVTRILRQQLEVRVLASEDGVAFLDNVSA